MMDGKSTSELARLTNALARAMVIGQVVYDTTGEGAEFREIVRHARELHDQMRETLEAVGADDEVSERHVCEALGNKLARLEAAAPRHRAS
jgi:hypothetical protein